MESIKYARIKTDDRKTRYRRRRFRKHSPVPKDKTAIQMKPAAEPMLNGVFARIGKPAEAPFVPDPFQIEALKAISSTDCLVMAPTGSGKTWIAERAIAGVLERGGRSWYASPLKALSNSKWVEFGHIFGPENVGILTGDTKENPDARVVVGTTEILRNQLYDAMHRGENLDCDLVVLDEAHFLGDSERGVVWEEIMMYLPVRINLLLLSATIGNGHEIARWLESIRGRKCVVIEEQKRPVPLYPLFLHPSGKLMPLLGKKGLYGKVEGFIQKGMRRRHMGAVPYGEIVEVLRTYDLLPAIFFLKSRSDCDAALKKCLPRLDADEKKFDGDLAELLEKFPHLTTHRQLPRLRLSRVASHHGGQLPAWKFLVEEMMKRGRLDVIFATSTVAAGVNFPARSIVLFNSDLYNGYDFLPLNATGFHQMTGRSGRRGKDKIGFLVAVPGRNMDLDHVETLLASRPEDIESRIRNDFSMVLNLLLSHRPVEIQDLFERSLASFQSGHNGSPDGPRRIWTDFQRHLAFLKAEGFVDHEDRLTHDGIWASRLRLDQPLLIAECLRKGVFSRHDEALLAAMVAPYVSDRGDEIVISKREIPRRLRRSFELMQRTIAPLAERMEGAGFSVMPLPLWTSFTLYLWTRGVSWEKLVEKVGIAEGDLVMLILRTADHLRQIAALHDTYPETAALALRAREAILREPVMFE